jgi:lipopolysaccharide transport system permease protein
MRSEPIPTNPVVESTVSLWQNRSLIRRLAWREVESRFRGSLLGLLWMVLLPLIMLVIYSVVFGSIFGSHWIRPHSARPGIASPSYPLILFSGLILFNIFADTVGRAPGLVLENISYVKKVVFPLQVLPAIALLTALPTALISLVLLLAADVLLHGVPPVTTFAIPFLVAPLLLITLGVTYLLASLGVFLRDLRQILPPVITAILFLSPIFYAIDSVPPLLRAVVYANPLSLGVIFMQNALFWGTLPTLQIYLLYCFVGLVIYGLGVLWFARTKKAFADVA